MAFDGLPTAKIEVPLSAGLNQKADPRALNPPALDIAKDVMFDEVGGLQTRYPFTALGSSIFGGGTLSSTRRLVVNGDELLCFTVNALYSWSAALSKWVLRSTYLAAKVDETSTFVTTGDQISCDRAELNGTIVFAWVDAAVIYVAAIDKTTCGVLLAPTACSSGEARPRLIALATKILLFVVTGDPQLNVYAIDPASPGTAIAGGATTVLATPNFNLYYDAVKIPGADTAIWAARRTTTTSYTLGTVTAALAVASSTKARTADGPLAVSCPPAGTTVQVIRANGTNIQGDYITIASFVDVTTGQAVGTVAGTPVNQIAAAHRSVQNSSANRCYVFWDAQEAADSTDWTSKFNFVDTAGAIGTQANFVRRLGVASRAFDCNGSVFVHGVFAGTSSFSGASASLVRAQLQNTYFLYRDDQLLIAKIAAGRAGGFPAATGHLPGVALTSGSTGYSWCAVERRIIELGGNEHSGYGARAPRDVTVTFDSNDARRCARLGQTLYVAGGEILQYDGTQLTEVGFHIFPWYFGAIEVPAGNLADGTYTLKVTWRWDNARGELDRSTTATSGQVTIAGGPNGISIVTWIPLYVTHKTTSAIAVEAWRTVLNAGLDAPFYLTTSKDPAALTNPNRYTVNTPTTATLATLNDELADASLTVLEANPENAGALENLSPPAASIIVASDTRIFLAGVAGDLHRVWYSKTRNEGEVASFHDALAFDIPKTGGDITALAFLFDTLIVFRETAIYEVRGDGFDNTSGGSNFEARLVSSDVGGVGHESIGLTPMGLVFKTSKGWYLLPPNLNPQYIGAPISDYDSETPLSVLVVENRHQVRVLTASRMLVWDYLVNQWGEWTIGDGLHATVWQGTYAYLTTDAVKTEGTTYSGVDYGMDVETAWIKAAELQGQSRVRRMLALGEYRSAHNLRIRIARDYESDGAGGWSYFDDITWSPPSSKRVVGGPEQFQRGPSRQRCEAIKIRLTVIGDDTKATLAAGVDYAANPITMQGPFGFWSPILAAVLPGADGNAISFQIGMKLGTALTVECRDHQVWDPATSTWSGAYGFVGVQIVATDNGGAAPCTAAAIEAAIATSELIRVATAHASPLAQVDMSAMTGLTLTGAIGDTTLGVDASTSSTPTGEALKLTGLALLVGVEPGLYRRLTAGQKAG